MNRSVRVVLVEEAEKEFKRLNIIVGNQIKNGKENSEEMQLLRSIKQKINFVKDNPFYGEPISKNLIPAEYKIKYPNMNLFRVELSQFWRMLYTLKGNEIEVIAFVLGIMDHPDYNKKFGYKKK